MMHQQSSLNTDSEEDEDDDLRSLLSNDSLSKKIANPHRKKNPQSTQGGIAAPTRPLGSYQDNPTQSLELQESNNQPCITHLDNMTSTGNERGRSVSPVPNHHRGGVGGNGGGASSHVNSKRTLYILGTIILAMGFVGPNGMLWPLIEDEHIDGGEGAPSNFANGYSHGQFASGSDQEAGKDRTLINNPHHGDKHHQLSPPPPNSINNNNHPMMRSNDAMVNSRQKFGRGKNKNQNNRKGKKKKDRGQVKEAIHNIDKVFMGTTVKKKKYQQQLQGREGGMLQGSGGVGGREDDDTNFLTDDEELLPVVHADDDTLPENAAALDTYTYSLPASDALECRESVVAFVINATDVKDECDGLRKAFDKTCSVSATSGTATGGGGESVQHLNQRRRRLSEWGQPKLFNLLPAAFHEQLQRLGEKKMDRLHVQNRRLSERTTPNVSNILKQSNRTLQEITQRKMEEEEDDSESEDNVSEDEEAETVKAQPVQQQQQQQEPPKISLNIPTADKHISEEMLSDALLLQQSSDAVPAKAASAATSLDAQTALQQTASAQEQTSPDAHNKQIPEDHPAEIMEDTTAAAPKQNITAGAAEAVQDAAESAEAIRTAVEGVKNIMNDPKSIEARTCCASILSVFHEHCDPTTTGVEDYSDRRLLVVVFVITVCGIVKSVIRHLNIRWLPEAGGCILVGVFGYLILQHMPHVQFAFDGDMFLRIMVPPIVFEAAVKINKQSFRRHVIPIVIFSIVGTLASTAFTAFILHQGSSMLGHYVTTIPVRESLIFGALISSIDPIAVLSILNTMGMTDTDTIYVLIFGESLLNDGVAIVLFQTLVHFLDETLVIDSDVVLDAFMHFVVVALGSVTVGMAGGACATVYFALMHGCQTPMVEVIMFCCWSFIPYYICDMVEWSGIVAIVANGFVMDLYVIGQKQQQHNISNVDDEIDFLVNGNGDGGGLSANGSGRPRKYRQQQCRRIFSYEGHLSSKADSHVHFVIEIFATLMETAIFAYLGLFLFSPRYHWSVYLAFISIFATVMGRVMMIPLFSHIANILNRMNLSRNRPSGLVTNADQGVHIDRRMQLVLVFAGLRGAMSFALVEHIPMFDTTTGQGSRFKPELKAMTSASVIFTVFVLGGATSYLMERLGYSLNKPQQNDVEIIPLVQHNEKRKSPAALKTRTNNSGLFSIGSEATIRKSNSVMRQRGPR